LHIGNKLTIQKNPNTKLANAKSTYVICLDKGRHTARTSNFNDVLERAVDLAFSSLLGGTNKQAIYHILAKRFGIRRTNIPRNVEGFSNALEKIFGQSACLLEVQIMKTLHDQISNVEDIQPEGLSFMGYVESLHRFFSCQALSETF